MKDALFDCSGCNEIGEGNDWGEINELSAVVSQYKQLGNNTIYLGEQEVQGPYSLIDIPSSTKIPFGQVRGRHIELEGKRLYSVNNKLDPEIQLTVNRIFAPFLSMSRLIRIKHKRRETILSSNVWDKKARSIVRHEPKTPQRILDLLRIIYQYIVCDSDRFPCHNLSDGIIYDFDYLGKPHKNFVNRGDDKIDFQFRNLTPEEIREVAQILLFFRKYTQALCQDLLTQKSVRSTTKKSVISTLLRRKSQSLTLEQILQLMIQRSQSLSCEELLGGFLGYFGEKNIFTPEQIEQEQKSGAEIDKILKELSQ